VLNPTLQKHFQEYSEYHQHPVNRLTHKVAIPLIVFHILAMLDRLQIPGTHFTTTNGLPYGLSVGHVFFAAVMAWYVMLNVKLAVLMFVFYAACFPLGMFATWPVLIGIAAVAWVIQLAGHAVWEKKSPAFLKNLVQALIGPLFFVAILTGDWRMPEQQPATT